MKFRGKRLVALLVTLGLLCLARSYWLGKARSELVSFGEGVKIGDPARAAMRQCELKSLLKCRGPYEGDVVAAHPTRIRRDQLGCVDRREGRQSHWRAFSHCRLIEVQATRESR